MAEPRQVGRTPYTGLRFDGSSFDSWQFGVKLAVQSEELWGIVKGTELMPEPVRVSVLINSLYSFKTPAPYSDTHTCYVRRETYHTGSVRAEDGLPHWECEMK
jgi:hypothetical protein